jgi:hypothetical protein
MKSFTKIILISTTFSLLYLTLPVTIDAAVIGGSGGIFDQGLVGAINWGRDPSDGGLSNLTLTGLILNITDYLVGMIGIISVLGIVIGGTLYVISAGNEQRAAQAKRIIAFSIIGLIIVLIRVVIIMLIYGWLGTPVPSTIPHTSVTFETIIRNIIIFLQAFLAAVATLLIIIGGFMYITSVGDEQKTGKAKQTIFAALIGLFVALIAGLIVDITDAIATDKVYDLSILGIKLINIISFVLSFTSIAAIAAFIYGGFTYLASGGNDEKIQRGKRILIYATVGIVVIMISAAIVNIVIGF